MKNSTYYACTILAVVLLFVVLSNVAYAMWSETLHVNMKMSMGEFDTRICCYRVLTCCHHCNVTSQLSDNSKALFVSFENLHPGWTGWVALIICNKGTLPAELIGTSVTIVEASDDIEDHFHYEIHYYGPLKIHDLKNIRCCHLPLPFNSSLPIQFDPGQKVLVLIELHIDALYHGEGELDTVFTIRTSLWH
ncbi:MAG: hypothetical protein DRO23_10015 [Thermoprotei archaeon]|nr:MAG: hypothetical protein DRO23_10015 [Thermoprotei archaeon]